MQITKNLLTGILCIFIFNAYAQDKSSISGKISENGLGLQDISVSISGTGKRKTLTDTDGSYHLTNLQAGKYTISISAIGYYSQQSSITLLPGQNIIQNFQLTANVQSLNGVTVSGDSKSAQLKHSGFDVNAIDINKYANSTTDLNQVLSRSAGINIREQGGLGSDFKFSVNGLSGKQVKFFIDGIPMENFGASLTLNNIPVNLAERIEVYEGVVPTGLGADALGGAVNIVTNQTLAQFLDASYSFGSFNTHRAALSGRYTDKKTGIMVDASGFFNYSDNSYLMRNSDQYDSRIRVIVGEGNNQSFEYRDSKRFHDGFQSLMGKVDISIKEKKWADLLKIGMLYSNQDKQIQTLATQEAVVGAATRSNSFFIPSVKYKKNNLFTSGLNLDLFASYARDNSQVTDTSKNLYDWSGRIYRSGNTAGEFSRPFSIYHFKNNFGLGQLNLGYILDDNQSLQFNYNISLISRKGFDELDANQSRNAFKDPNRITKGVTGLSWQSKFFGEKLSSSVFIKNYDYRALVRSVVNYVNGVGLKTDSQKKNYNYMGYGFATRYQLSSLIGAKISAEHAYRMQDAEELFGDGITILANPELKPEESNNLNIGIFLNKISDLHRLSVELGGFIRSAKNFIYFTPTQSRYSIYSNELDVTVNGLEGDIGYTYKNLIQAGVNITYQNARRTNGYQDRIPNQPYLLGNAELTYMKAGLLGKGTDFSIGWFGQYIKDYFLSWPAQGTVDSKSIIPTQFIHNATASISFQDHRYTLSADVRNLTDRLAYDDFKLQKPGRAMYVKLRYLIK